MPIYEFYCATCHTVFSFFSRTMNTTKKPFCPRCRRPELERQVSRFAISSGRAESEPQDDGLTELDMEKINRAVKELGAEHDRIDHSDPRHVIPMIQKVYKLAGMPIPERAQEAIRRIEAGDDMDKINEEFGDLWVSDDSPFLKDKPPQQHGDTAPYVDDMLYAL